MAKGRYIVVPVQQGGDELGKKITSLDAEVSDVWAPWFWLVSYSGTTEDLADAIGLGDDQNVGMAIVLPVTNYAGYAHRSLWEWLRLHRDDG